MDWQIKRFFLLLFCFGFLSTAESQSILDSFQFTTDFTSRPTFIEESNPFFTEDGGFIYLGKTADWDKAGLYFYHVKEKRKVFFPVETETAFLENKHLFVGEVESSGIRIPLVIKQVLYFDTKVNEIGLLLENRHKSAKGIRFFLGLYDLKNQKFSRLTLVFDTISETPKSYFQTSRIGYNPETKTLHFAISVDPDLKSDTEDVKIYLHSYKNGVEEKPIFLLSRFLPYTSVYHRPSGFVAISAYAEAFEKKNPQGIFWNTETGKIVQFPIPSTPYGISFSQDANYLYMVASDTGEMRKYSTSDLSKWTTAKWGTHGHQLGFWNEKELVWVRNSGLHVYDPISLKQTKIIPTKNFYKGNINVSGSTFAPEGKLLLRNILENPELGAMNRILEP